MADVNSPFELGILLLLFQTRSDIYCSLLLVSLLLWLRLLLWLISAEKHYDRVERDERYSNTRRTTYMSIGKIMKERIIGIQDKPPLLPVLSFEPYKRENEGKERKKEAINNKEQE